MGYGGNLNMGYKNKIPTVDSNEIKTQDIHEHEEGYDRHEGVYFAFIDVLGFKNLYTTEQSSNAKSKKSFSDLCGEVFDDYFDSVKFLCEKRSQSLFCIGQISDTLYCYTDNCNMLIDFLYEFQCFNLRAMSQGIFFRGGVAHDEIFCRDDFQYYGKCVINAYMLEEEISKMPRIVIDYKTYNDIQKCVQEHEPPCGVNNFVIEGKDGRYYLDVFGIINVAKNNTKIEQHIVGEMYSQVNDLVTQLEKRIGDSIQKFEFDYANHQKYVYLKNDLGEKLQEKEKI